MDVSGGNGQPRPGDDKPAEHPAGPTPPPADPTGPEPRATPATPSQDATEPTDHPRQERQATPAPPGRDASERPVDPRPRPDGNEPGAPEAAPVAPPGTTSAAPPHAPQGPAQEPDGEGARPVSPEPPSGDHAPAAPPPGAARPEATDPAAGTEQPPADSAAGDRTGPAGHRAAATSGIAKGEPPQRRPREPGGGLLMGRPFGVPVYVAPSWFLVAALITWVFGGQLDRVLPELGAARYLVSLFFAVAFYASVLVHELAHTVAAIRFGLPVRRIQLQFFGGVSEIEKEAEAPGREFVLAFVGPLLSLVLAGVFYLAMQPVQPDTVLGVLLAGLMISNLIVAIFNLLPGLPLDGGRMLRAVVWKITGRPMAGTVAAAWVGRALALSVLVGLPLLNHSGAFGGSGTDVNGMDTVTDALLAAILAAIIWTGAGNSLRMARLREHLPELKARTLTRRAVPVENDTPLSEALRRANAAGARALVVVDADGHPLALVREAAIVGVPEHRRPWVAVSGLAQELTDGMRVSAELSGEELLDALRATPATEYLVVEETGEIYGVLSAADVERAFVKAMARPS